jgi:hypothetical protein
MVRMLSLSARIAPLAMPAPQSFTRFSLLTGKIRKFGKG